MISEFKKQLELLALKRSTAFCYGCYLNAPSGRCTNCGSDDLMRLLPGVGCEYGLDWVIDEILRSELTPVDVEEAFEQSVRECYPEETKVGWMTFDTVTLMKENDPISWSCALSEYQAHGEDEGNLVSCDGGSDHFWVHEVESLIERDS